ncbi:MAG: hypothetical protein O6920_01425, partial [Chloroflexi bacterium]|nr:hypothetical protein [Chloroflexota bacterium]
MDIALLKLRGHEAALLARAQEVYRWRNLRDGEPGDAVFESLETYVTLYQERYGSAEDALSQGVVYGRRRRGPSPADLDEVARLLVNGDASNHNVTGDVNTSRSLLPTGLADLTPKESDLLAKTMVIYQRKNRRGCQPRDVVLESLELYIKLYELLSTPQDELSKVAVFGPNAGETPAE